MDAHRRLLLTRAACLLPGLVGGVAIAGSTAITYPRVESFSDHFFDYYWLLLEGALQRTEPEFGAAHAVPSGEVMNHERALRELLAGTIKVYRRGVLPTDFADRLMLVSVPLDRGLLGYRAFIIHKSLQPRLARVRRVEDLKGLRFGLVAGWSGVQILRHAGLDVVTTMAYEGVFPMLQRRRFDVLSLSIGEIVGEFNKNAAGNPDLVIDDALLLVYPLSFYFIVTKTPEGERLRQRLTLGLQRMRADGSLDALNGERKEKALKGMRLTGRRVLRIDNPHYRDPMYALKERHLWETLAAELRG